MARKSENKETSNLATLKESVPIEKKVLLTLKEACALSGIASDVIYEVIQRPEAQDFVVKHGRKNFIHREKFEAYLGTINEF